MFRTFRAKLTAIVGVAGVAFSIVIVVSWIITSGVAEQLVSIQERFVPQLELGPQLETQFDQLRRSLQDAVAARDGDALEATQDQYEALQQRLVAGRELLAVNDAELLRSSLQEWYEAARELSQRMIEGETGEDLVKAMSGMQAKQSRSLALLKKVTAFDRRAFAHTFEAASRALETGGRLRMIIGSGCLAFVIALSFWLSRQVLKSLAQLNAGLERIGAGNFDVGIPVSGDDELADVARNANRMAQNLKRLEAERVREDWLKNALVGLAKEIRGELSPEEVGARAARFVARYLDAPVAALYYTDASRVLRLTGEYGLAPMDPELAAALSFRIGEGLVGQACLQEGITIIPEPPPNYLKVRSGVGEGTPRALAFVPILHLGAVSGVLEIGLFKPWSDTYGELLLSMREMLAIAIEVARTRVTIDEMLSESQRQAERLAAQEEELQSNNDQLQTQQEELRQTNEELTQQTAELEAQRRSLQEKNQKLDQASRSLQRQAEELKKVSAYKSQFLANMSHELRTPLNSMLLLSNLLAENEGNHLTAKQVEFARTIHSAGKELLALINQVLDLAKVEAGKQELRVESVPLAQIVDHVERVFRPLATHKKLEFRVSLQPGLPASIDTDAQRLQQILNNLLANAVKFTQRGQVALEIRPCSPGEGARRADLAARGALAFAVSDTGVGIAAEHQERIFAPFEQVEAASDRRFGGSGLGLTIARELSELMGGTLELVSAPGRGSTFTCMLPYEPPAQRVPREHAAPSQELDRAPQKPPPVLGSAADAYLLVVEDDPEFADTVGEVIQQQGLAWDLAVDGRTALELCRQRPPSGIILDLKLPDMDGWQVMERLREESNTRNVPVHFVSAADAAERALAMGAVGYLTKPVTRQDLTRAVRALAPGGSDPTRSVLLVESDAEPRDSLAPQLAVDGLEVKRVVSAAAALAVLEQGQFACVVLNSTPPELDGPELARALHERRGAEAPPIIVYTAHPLSKEEAKHLDAYAEAVVLKEGSSSERLLDEVRLFVRRLKGGLVPRRNVRRSLPPNVQLQGRRVLVVDDDMRTVYALSATLRAKGAEVLVADNGKVALGVLSRERRMDAVLMDIMMPELDGYETMRRIRQDLKLLDLTIIALTAKAMKGDRERCLEAGASDYLPKPVDPERLLAMLHARVNESAEPAAQPNGAERVHGA